MPKTLTPLITEQLDTQNVRMRFVFQVNGAANTDLLTWKLRADRSFGTMSGIFEIRDPLGIYSPGGSSEINIGDTVELIEYFGGDATTFPHFYGYVRQRAVHKTFEGTVLSLSCLDLIVKLQEVDIDTVFEGTKTEIVNETLTANQLPAPNGAFAAVFNFRNNSIAEVPRPIIVIRDRGNRIPEDPQIDGFEINYPNGQLKLGLFLNTTNFSVVSPSYHYYVSGLHIEDIIEELLTTADGYGNFLFGAASAQAVIDDHLTSSLYDADGKTQDTLIPNLLQQSVTVTTTLTAGAGPGATSITVASTDGFPSGGVASGTANINGDTFTWTGRTATTLTGIPATGENALQGHNAGDIVKYVNTYPPGQLWSLSYGNLLETPQTSEFTVPGGTIDKIDTRAGMLILTAPISTVSNVTLNRSYRFKTLQPTGIQINRISFRERGIGNRFDAITELRRFIAPNYILRTRGTKQLWATYLNQKIVQDYTLQLPLSVQYVDDEETFTRVVNFAKNNNPSNLMLDPNVAFVATGQTFNATASNVELTYDSDDVNYRVYKSAITDAGRITTETIQPSVTVNGIPLNDVAQELLGIAVTIDRKTQVVTTTKQHASSTEVRTDTYVFYTVKLPFQNIDPTQTITFYDATSTLLVTLSPGDGNMSYETGEWRVPGAQPSDTIERIASADFWVRYAASDVLIDLTTVRFRIAKRIIPVVGNAIVRATFEYITAVTELRSGGFAFDGRYDTQVQTVFYAEPPTDMPYAIIDLGATKMLQALDFVAGFFKPDPNSQRRYDIVMQLTLQSSTDNVTYRVIDAKTSNFKLTGGETVAFDEDVLGEGFQARYLRLDLARLQKIDYGLLPLTPATMPGSPGLPAGVWVVAFTEIQAFTNVILRSEATLIPNTHLTATVSAGATTLTVYNTGAFPSSGTLYINETDVCTYTGKTTTTFTGVSGVDSAHGVNERVAKSVAGDTSLYDDRSLLIRYGDKVFKDRKVNEFLTTQAQVDRRSLLLLKEFVKNQKKLHVDVLYGPHYEVGQTLRVNEPQLGVAENYFVEMIADANGHLTLELARYP